MAMVLPVFIDVVNERLLPEVLRDKGVLERNCPVYKSSFEPKSEINQYCFYHIVSFLLKVDFNSIYDRYHIYSLKKKRELKLLRWIFYTMLTALVSYWGPLTLPIKQKWQWKCVGVGIGSVDSPRLSQVSKCKH